MTNLFASITIKATLADGIYPAVLVKALPVEDTALQVYYTINGLEFMNTINRVATDKQGVPFSPLQSYINTLASYAPGIQDIQLLIDTVIKNATPLTVKIEGHIYPKLVSAYTTSVTKDTTPVAPRRKV